MVQVLKERPCTEDLDEPMFLAILKYHPMHAAWFSITIVCCDIATLSFLSSQYSYAVALSLCAPIK